MFTFENLIFFLAGLAVAQVTAVLWSALRSHHLTVKNSNPEKHSEGYEATMGEVLSAARVGTVFGTQDFTGLTQDEIDSLREAYLTEVEQEAHNRASNGYSNHVRTHAFFRADDEAAIKAYNRGHKRGVETLKSVKAFYHN